MSFKFNLIILSVILLIGCGSKNENQSTGKETNQNNTLGIKVRSDAFEEGGMIPEENTCDGDNVSPEISWGGAPAETKSFALICDDPDAPAGTWVHWVVYNIPANKKGLHEGISADKKLYDGTMQGINDFREYGYGGPCPPKGSAHSYYFKVYALDTTFDIQKDVSKAVLLEAMKGHILAQGQLIGMYSRN